MSYYGVTLEDLQNLPPTILNELNTRASFVLEWQIIDIINDLGGVASIDKIVISYWRKHETPLTRTLLNAKLYRMKHKGLLDSDPKRKGVYATNNHSRLPDTL